MTIYYVSLYGGLCGLTTDPPRVVIKREGTANVKSVTRATKAQIEYVRSMGGYVPKDAPAQKE
jgi:hypothetical protein